MLKVQDLVVAYGEIAALKGVSLEVGRGEIVALLGANGAGKSTTLRAISGLIGLKSGRIEYEGRSLQSLKPYEIARLGVVQCPEGRRLFANLTVLENLEMGACCRGDRGAVEKPVGAGLALPKADEIPGEKPDLPSARRGKTRRGTPSSAGKLFQQPHRKDIEGDVRKACELFPVLGQRRRQMAGTLSGGEQQMLALARALMARPRLLLLDEPSLGLAPILIDQIFSTIARIREEGVTILLVEQNAHMALEVADRAYVLEAGRISISGPAGALRSDSGVVEAYLGGA